MPVSKLKLVNRGPAGLLKKKGKLVLVNRGPAGLLKKPPKTDKRTEFNFGANVKDGNGEQDKQTESAVKKGPINRIAKSLAGLVIDIDKLTPDPLNARLHPERNMVAIRDSLNLYGQRKPIVVRRQGMVVVAGNGTLEAAKQLGWTKIAASVETMTDVEAVGYGIADNRTAEHARWNTEVLPKLEKILAKSKHPLAGWSDAEILAMRASEVPDPPSEFPEFDESVDVQHICPKCGYAFSGG
jgi:hypothetical protein